MGRIQAHFRNKLVAGALAAIPLVVTVFILWYVDSKARAIFNVDYPFVGIALALAGLYLLGLFVTSLVGQFLLGAVDAVLRRLPGLRDLYRSWKQVGFTSAKGIEGDPTTWCVFVSASPNPTSGRLFFVPSKVCVLVGMSAQEAL